jgi:hypothetical protein
MKILITGATGFVGKKLTDKLIADGHTIHILTRNKRKAKKKFPFLKVNVYEWNNYLTLPPAEAFVGISGVINLMGENIAAHRWSDHQKKILKESRVDATKNLVKQIEATQVTPLDFYIQASAIGIYPVNNALVLDEYSPLGDNFLATLCKEWEDACTPLTKTNRFVIVRTGVVLEKDGGALKKMLPPFLLGLGGTIGNGMQVMSWIHRDDLVMIYQSSVMNRHYQGIINATAPHPVTNRDFTKALGSTLHRPTLIPIPTLPLKIAFGEMSSIILDSQSVISKRLTDWGFHFLYPRISQALNAIFEKK